MSKVSKTISDIDHLCTEVISCLEDNKGENIVQLSVSKLTTIADYFVIVTGNSSRHVRALAINAVRDLRDKGIKSLRMEGEDSGEWAVIDYGDIIIHVMQPEVRAFYDLESLWRPGFAHIAEKLQ